MKLAGTTVVIIGGSSGMGLATARAAVAEGAAVLIASRSEEKLGRAADEIDGEVTTRVVDVTREEQLKNFFAEVGDFDHLAVTAATGATGPFFDLDTATVQGVFASKFWGQYFAVKYGAPWVREGGSITLFSGVAAARPVAGMSTYAAINGAVEALCRALAVELAPLRINAVSPGLIDTPAYEGMTPHDRKALFEMVAERVPARRVGRAEDAAQAVLSLMKNGYVTGTVMTVDGGYRIA